MSAQKTRYICKVCSAIFPSNQTLQKHLSNKKAHASGGGAPASASTTSTSATSTSVAGKACVPCVAAAAAKNKAAKK